MKKTYVSALFTLFFLFAAMGLPARSWDDLHETSEKVFGSEKEAKYDINIFFIERERWEDHYSLKIFWLYKQIDYPKYSSFMLLPFYYGLESKIDERKFSFIPVLLTYWETDVIETFSYTDDKNYQKQKELTDFKISPLFFSQTEASEKLFWFPIIPLFFKSTNPFGEHINILWLIDFTWNREKNGKEYLERLFVIPFLFHKPGSSGYTHILPPVFLYDKNELGYFLGILPLFIKGKERDESYNSSFFISLLFCKSSFADETEAESRFWLPIVPVFYHSKNNESSHTNLLWIFDWKKDEAGKMERLFILPFLLYSFAENGYMFLIPFYFKLSSESSEEGLTFSPFYYHRWSSKGDTKWSWLIHYKSDDFSTGEKTNIWFPFYYSNETPENESIEQKKYYSKIIAPLYWHINTARSDTTLFLPLYFETVKNDGNESLYINILGYSKSILAGTSPIIGAGAGINQKGAYIDADASWLYDMASVSTRLTIPLKDSETPAEISDTGVTISKVNNASREDALNFWGFRLFYGLVAFNKADSRRHFRLLPLSWLTWDKASDDNFTVILNFLSYKNEDTEYLVFFPIYGYQRVGESFSKGYLLNAYWHEYDSEAEMTERTILWPLINWYSSPKSNGFRIIPLVRRRNIVQDDSSLYSSTYTPLYIGRSIKSADDGSTLYRFNMSLLHFYKYTKEPDSQSKLWFSLIPFIFNKENTSSENEISMTHKLKWFFPLFMTKETEKTADGKTYSFNYRLWGLPFLYYRKSTQFDPNGDIASQRYNFFLLGYQRKSGDILSNSFLFGLYENESDTVSQNYSHSFLYGLGNISEKNESFTNYFRPLYYYANNDRYKEKSFLMGLYRHRKNNATGDTALSLFYYLFYSSNSTHYATWGLKADEESNSFTETEIIDENETWLIPLFYKTSLVHRDGSESKRTSFSLLHYRSSEITLHGTSKTAFYPIIPIYYRSENNQESHINLFWLFDRVKGQDSERMWIIPFYFRKIAYQKNNWNYRHVLTPFYFSSWNEDRNITSKTILGFNFYDSPQEKEENFLYIFRHYRAKNYEYEYYSLLFSLSKFEKHSDYNSFTILGGFLTDVEWHNRDRYNFDALLYLASIEKYQQTFHTRIIPLWYYNRSRDTTLLVIPPALTWNSEDYYGKFQLWVLGALWFRNYKSDEGKDLQALLLGIPYYKLQDPERGYESWGSLWGLLWQYEKESETGFSKFSLLKILYRRTVIDGEVTHRILGIRF